MLTAIANRLNTLLLVALVLMAAAIIGILATRASGGPLDPPAAPASTLQSLGQMPPDWSQQLDSTNGGSGGCGSTRFECVMGSFPCNPTCHFFYDGVLDHETGLVWERDPNAKGSFTWEGATEKCYDMKGGGRAGWRPATLPELMSLLDPSVVSPSPSLPAGNPFINLGSGSTFWSTTEVLGSPTYAFVVQFVGFGAGNPGLRSELVKSSLSLPAWCVRGAVTQ